jgi:hypothetical protein
MGDPLIFTHHSHCRIIQKVDFIELWHQQGGSTRKHEEKDIDDWDSIKKKKALK